MAMALLGVVALSGLALIVLNQSKTDKDISSKLMADRDLDAAVLKIASTLLQPKNCNATFYGQNVDSGTLSTIQSCTSGNCLNTTGTGKALVATVMDAAKVAGTAAIDQWNPSPSFTGLTRKVRISSLTYVLDQDQTTGVAVAKPAVLKLTIVFEKNLGLRSKSGVNTIQTSKITKEIFVPVVRGTFTPPATYTSSTTILGCPISPTSTVIQSS